MSMKKYFILDTNVLLLDPEAFCKFADNIVVIPISVVEEIDTFKRDLNGLGRNARHAIRLLDKFRRKGNLSQGVEVNDKGGVCMVDLGSGDRIELPPTFARDKVDNRLLVTALSLMKKQAEVPVILVTKDANLRIKADALGIKPMDYESKKVEIEHLYRGFSEVQVNSKQVQQFYNDGAIKLDKENFYPNQFAILKGDDGLASALARFHHDKGMLLPLDIPHQVWGISPRNTEQSFCFDLLLDDGVNLVTLVGKAGTGKTLLAIAAGLAKTVDDGIYERLLVSRPIFPLGRDIGYLPGDVTEKLAPWMQPIFDNLDLIFQHKKKDRKQSADYYQLIRQGLVQIEPLTYIRGRSIPRQYIIVDEAQNLNPHEIKTIISRAGDDAKIVLTGDPYQIDNPFLDSASNGLSYLVERFKGQEISGHVMLFKGERSKLAELAANLL